MKARLVLLWLAASGPFLPSGAFAWELNDPTKVIDQYGGQLRSGPEKISTLPARIATKEREVSLFVDLEDRRAGRVAIYLLNGSDKPVTRVVHSLNDVWQETMIGGRWQVTDFVGPGCGTVPPPIDLPPGETWIISGRDPMIGANEGDIRYCLSIPGGRPVSSAIIKGRYDIREELRMVLGEPAFESDLTDIRGPVIGDKGRAATPMAQGPEKAAICLELLRHLGPSESIRSAVTAWLDRSPPEAIGKETIRRIIDAEWPGNIDENRFFNRCLTELRTISSNRHRTVIWKTLEYSLGSPPFHFVNPERYDQLERYRASGNPWGASAGQIDECLDFAYGDLRHEDPSVKKATASLLLKNWITPEHVQKDRLPDLLASGDPLSVRVGLVHLSKNTPDEAHRWISRHPSELGDQLPASWSELRDRNKSMEPWETPLVMHMLEQDPLNTFSDLNSRCFRYEPPSSTKLDVPHPLRLPIRRVLEKEAQAQSILGVRPARSPWSTNPPPYDPSSGHPQFLGQGISLLASFEDPADDKLIARFLSHPGSGYAFQNKTSLTRFYTVRSVAAQILKKRGKPVPNDLVLDENFTVPDE